MRKAIAAAMGAAAIGLGLALSAAATARAQSASDLLAKIGLLGRWSRDCEGSPMGANAHTVFERVQGGTGAQFRIDAGTDGSIRRMIDDVRVLSSSTVVMRIKTMPGADEPMNAEVVIEYEANRLRAISSVAGDGKFHIRDGKFVANGSESPWSLRCPE